MSEIELARKIEALEKRIAQLQTLEQQTIALNVKTFGARGDGTTDDTAAIQAAIDTGVLLSSTYGQSRYGRLVIELSPGSIYRITSPLDLCEKESILIDGGSSVMGALILAETDGKAAIEIIGSQNIHLHNLQIYGPTVDGPSVGVYASRSNTVHGVNSVHNTFRNVMFNGYYDNTCFYGVNIETHRFIECNFGPVDVGDAVVYLSQDNALSLTPEHATLAGTTYGLYNINFNYCHMSSAADATTLYCNEIDTDGVVVRDCYLYGDYETHPTVVFEGSGIPHFDNVLFEGQPGTRLLFKYKVGATNVFSGSFRDIGWGASDDYLMYADDDTELRSMVFDGYHNQSYNGTTYAPVSIYDANMCDFSGLGYYQGYDFAFTIRRIGRANKIVLGPSDTYSISQSAGNIVENLTDTTGNYWKIDGSYSSLQFGNGAWDGGHIIIGAYHLWVDATGVLRIKSGAPANGTDGTIVGTQS